MVRVLITGSREWKWSLPVQATILGHPKGTHFIIGDCPPGVDKYAWDALSPEIEQYDSNGDKIRVDNPDFTYSRHIAPWKTMGHAAGPYRNGLMVADNPDYGYAFRTEGPSPGTDDCMRQALESGIPMYFMRRQWKGMPDNSVVPGVSNKGRKK